MNDHDLSLKALIRAVSDELLASREERLAGGKPALFEIQELVVEVSFVVIASKGGGGGFDLKVIRADADVKFDKQSIHKVTLKLRALGEADSVLTEVGDELPVRPRTSEE